MDSLYENDAYHMCVKSAKGSFIGTGSKEPVHGKSYLLQAWPASLHVYSNARVSLVCMHKVRGN